MRLASILRVLLRLLVGTAWNHVTCLGFPDPQPEKKGEKLHV
jgi:hypothetical protein